MPKTAQRTADRSGSSPSLPTSALKTDNNATAPPPLTSDSFTVSMSICARRSTPLLMSFCPSNVSVRQMDRVIGSRAWRSSVLCSDPRSIGPSVVPFFNCASFTVYGIVIWLDSSSLTSGSSRAPRSHHSVAPADEIAMR